MIISTGIDIIEVCRIQKALANERFRQRIFTQDEQYYCESKGMQKYASYAARFAAKEAVYKAMNLNEEILTLHWKDIEVKNSANEKPVLILHGGFKELQSEQQLQLSLSISHTSAYAVAHVICYKESAII